MRADIHDGPEHMLQSDTEYIDARPHQPASTKSLLHRAAGPYIWVKKAPSQASQAEVCSTSESSGRHSRLPSTKSLAFAGLGRYQASRIDTVAGPTPLWCSALSPPVQPSRHFFPASVAEF